ncbi:hypothetical protein PV390_06865 [Streptomyces sp. ME02-6991-2A]|nr:hypothetical protein [Streptomyces sp. ME02-6991-2A]MDX3374128.1 hypothetical protein [Streptomyces sp. ME02-6991-2A]
MATPAGTSSGTLRKSTTCPRITVAYASVWSVPQIMVGTYAWPSGVS